MAIFSLCYPCKGKGIEETRYLLFFTKKTPCPICKGTGKNKVIS